MDFFDLVNISETDMELVNPSTPEKIIRAGSALHLEHGDRVIDFGCGYGEVLALWAEKFGISGTGIELREHACHRAVTKMIDRGLAERIEIVCGNAADYLFTPHSFDAAICLGASFIWGGFQGTIQAIEKAVRSGGRLAIGEPYWLSESVPQECKSTEPSVGHEVELLAIARQEGFDIEYVIRASQDDWDGYEAGNWQALVRWIAENPDHPERQEVIDHLHNDQAQYFKWNRPFLGWAIYILHPVSY